MLAVVVVLGLLAGGGDDDAPEASGAPIVTTFSHSGSSNFVVRSWGDRRSLMVNEIGAYTGTVRLPDAVALEINADGNWTLEAQ